MSAKSSLTKYGVVAAAFHWLSAVLIFALLGLGFWAGQTTDLASKALLLKLHAPLGLTVFLLTVGRLVWWWKFDKKPALLDVVPVWQDRLARIIHVSFYVIIIGMTVSGISMFVLSGAGEILLNGTQKPLPDFSQLSPRIPHGIGARIFIVLLSSHIGAALFHHFIRRDDTLRRMWIE
ncbi:MAG: cytochrome b/b6 domain-containing protein [Hyphomicrobiales bacterium]